MQHSNTTTLLSPPRHTLFLLPAILVLLVFLLQGAGWAGWLMVADGTPGKTAFAITEMLLIFVLLWNGWRIRRHVHEQTSSADRQTRSVATLTLASLALCSLGDLVNRNFSQTFYAHDRIIEHSYLVDSVWFFLPGYALFVVATWLATRERVRAWLRWSSLAITAAVGIVSFAGLVLPGTSPYVVAVTGSYTVLISLMVPAALWLAITFGRSAWPVCAGAVLATLADALIGHFWLFGHGHYPAIAYLNFVVYFVSQALVQQLPLVVLATATHARPSQTGRPD
ncbi:MAG TPA: hypothetical protein DF427_02160 [Moraxellaceae bacterium]|nr:hypothetical protein [Moraxellaceae bacterium]